MRVSMHMWKLVLVVALVSTGAPALGQSDAKMSDQDKAMMEMMAKAATPGEQHRLLQEGVGRWNVSVKAWMAPGQPPLESKGNAEVTALLGGRYFQESFTGDFMGMPFQGMGVTGYDNVTKRFQSTWIDSFGTGVILLKGDYDAASKSYTFTGEYTDPTGRQTTMKIVQRLVDRDTHVSEFYDKLPDGQSVKTMEMTYTRVK